MSPKVSSTETRGRQALEKMGLDSEFVTIPRELFCHLREAHSLLGKGLNYVGDTAKWSQLVKKEELRTLVAAWTPLSRHGHFRACLDDAETSLFRIEGKEVFCMVPSLVASLNDCVSNDYDIEMQKGHRNVTRRQQAAHEQSRSLQMLCLLSSMSRLKNFKCCPPIIMMNSYRFYWHGAQQSLLSTNVSTRSLFGPDWYEEMTIQLEKSTHRLYFLPSV